MAWSYSGNPLESPLDEARFLLGDTNESDQLLSNEEIDYLLERYTDVHWAASEAARTISAKFARDADKTIGPLQIKYSQRANHYASLADVISGGLGGVSVVPVPLAGGCDPEDIPSFGRHSMDYYSDNWDARAGG